MRVMVSFVLDIWVVFGAVIHHVGGAWSPVIMLLTLRFVATEPVKAHVHGFNMLGDNGVVSEPVSCGVVGLDGRLSLRSVHFSEGVL